MIYRKEGLKEPLSGKMAMGNGAEALTSHAKRNTMLQLAAIAEYAPGQV